MPAAHGVPRRAQDLEKLPGLARGDRLHRRNVHGGDAVVDLGLELAVPAQRSLARHGSDGFLGLLRRRRRLRERLVREGQFGPLLRRIRHVVRVAEAETPVAEVGTDDEGIGWIGEVGSQQGADRTFRLRTRAANHDRDQRRVFRRRVIRVFKLQATVDVGQVHLEAVLSFVDPAGHGLVTGRGGTELVDQFGVEGKGLVGQRSRVGRHLREGNGREGMVMGGSQQEDAFALFFSQSNATVSLVRCLYLRFGQVQSLVCVRSTWPGVRVSRVTERSV